jgi:hypothetical protein
MQLRHKVVVIVLGVLFAALGIMLLIGLLLRGDSTPTDKNNSDVNSNTSQVVGWRPAGT